MENAGIERGPPVRQRVPWLLRHSLLDEWNFSIREYIFLVQVFWERRLNVNDKRGSSLLFSRLVLFLNLPRGWKPKKSWADEDLSFICQLIAELTPQLQKQGAVTFEPTYTSRELFKSALVGRAILESVGFCLFFLCQRSALDLSATNVVRCWSFYIAFRAKGRVPT